MKKCKKLFPLMMSTVLLCGCSGGASDADHADVETTTTESTTETTKVTTTEKKTTTEVTTTTAKFEQVQFNGYDPETNYDFEIENIVFSIPKNWKIKSDTTKDYIGVRQICFENDENKTGLTIMSLGQGSESMLDFAKGVLEGFEVEANETKINGLNTVCASGLGQYYSKYFTVYSTDNKKIVTVELGEMNDDQILFKDDYMKIIQNATIKGKKAQTTQPKSTQSSGIRPEFKQMIDEYEAFFKKYVDFMKKYNESSSLEMMAEYLDMLGKLSVYQEKLDAVEDMEMNDAEQAYYAEATLRISKMMLEVSLT